MVTLHNRRGKLPFIQRFSKENREMQKSNTIDQLGRYRLLRTLASKEHLDVFEGVHLDLGRRAAIKALYLCEMRDKRERQRAAERFRQESYRLEHIRHPHIVELYDYGEEDGIGYMVMQFAPYGSLASLHQPDEQLSFARIRRYAQQIGSALQALHDAGLIHRDVKPGNIFLGANKQVLLGDFGLVTEDQSRQMPRSFLEYGGTKGYMAPEQAKGVPCPASDQYALATMLFEWLAGCRTFEGTADEILYQRQFYPAPSLQEFASDIPAAVERVILKGLQIDPFNRYKSVHEFVNALECAFNPPGRHVATVRLPYYAGTAQLGKAQVVRRYGSRPGQPATGRKAMPVNDGHSSEALRLAPKEDVREPQFDGITVQPMPLSIHEDAFEVDECDLELVPADGEGLVRKVWNRLGSWGKS